MAVPLLDLSRQYRNLKTDLDKAVLDVLEHGQFILGPEVRELEEQVAALCTTRAAWGVASGTDALLLALRACGVKPGDEVITPDFSFFATAGTVVRLGATPVLVDIEPDTYNVNPALIEEAVTSKTRAIVPVHLFGQVADMDPIMAIAEKHGLAVIEDAAQAIGAEYKGRRAGSIGHVGCFSFYPTKNLGAGGDGGMIVTSDESISHLLKILRVHGAEPKYYHKLVGYNSRLATIQAAMLLVKLPYLHRWSEARVARARIYDRAFAGVTGIRIPVVKDYSTFHIYNQYTIAGADRDRLTAYLKERKIGFEIYYPVPFHKQECFTNLNYSAEQMPVSARAAREVLSLPIYPELTDAEQQEVIEAVIAAVS